MQRTTTRMAGAVVLAGALALTGCAEQEPVEEPVVEDDDLDLGEDPAFEEPAAPADAVETTDVEMTVEDMDDATADS